MILKNQCIFTYFFKLFCSSTQFIRLACPNFWIFYVLNGYSGDIYAISRFPLYLPRSHFRAIFRLIRYLPFLLFGLIIAKLIFVSVSKHIDGIDIKEIEILPGVNNIGNNAFIHCWNVENVNLGKVSRIGMKAFMTCSKLKTIEIPDTVTKIELAAFNGCLELKTIEIPQNVESIGSFVFLNCSLEHDCRQVSGLCPKIYGSWDCLPRTVQLRQNHLCNAHSADLEE